MFDAIAIDVIGMPGVYDIVNAAGVPCMPVNVSENSPMHEERFHRLRDELWWNAREFFTSDNAVISSAIDQEIRNAFIADIQNIHYQYKEITGVILVDSKKKMKEEIGFSPDLGDAFIHTFMPGLEAKASYGNTIAQEARVEDFDALTYGLEGV